MSFPLFPELCTQPEDSLAVHQDKDSCSACCDEEDEAEVHFKCSNFLLVGVVDTQFITF